MNGEYVEKQMWRCEEYMTVKLIKLIKVTINIPYYKHLKVDHRIITSDKDEQTSHHTSINPRVKF